MYTNIAVREDQIANFVEKLAVAYPIVMHMEKRFRVGEFVQLRNTSQRTIHL